MGLFACFGGKKQSRGSGTDAKASGNGPNAHANESDAVGGTASGGANPTPGSAQAAQNFDTPPAGEHASSGAVGGKKPAGKHDPGPGRTPPAGRGSGGAGDGGHESGRNKPANEENAGGGRDGGDAGTPAMTEAQKREAEYAAMEEEQHRRLVARVTKWVEDANSHVSEMMSLSVDLSTLRNIEEISNPDTAASAAGGTVDAARREATMASSSGEPKDSRQTGNEQNEVAMQA
eukprot:CAMPEP_0185843944 /NCGR_PEP_ID=MMETSP1354-20130828/295_1 /TAXON_ID=708628 /ORGANISM="Erythrolobus madagascarensis, Strain CCMP3276" /LENGTH=232 /DNA_ID=CAMNT_0028543539 /DNA_START=325 /DNA_END=1023 /DNA_ORIENTATION=+